MIVFVGYASRHGATAGHAGVTAMTIMLWATEVTYTLANPVVDLAFFSLGMTPWQGWRARSGAARSPDCSRRSSRWSP